LPSSSVKLAKPVRRREVAIECSAMRPSSLFFIASGSAS
jgi:hypothetical protein